MFKLASVAVAVLLAASAVSAQMKPSYAQAKVNSFQFCARPVFDSYTHQPFTYVDIYNEGTEAYGIPGLFLPWAGPGGNEYTINEDEDTINEDEDFPNYGYLGNLISSSFGFETPIVNCASAAQGKYNAESGAKVLGTMYGQCQATSNPLFDQIFGGLRRKLAAEGKKLTREEMHRHLQTEEDILTYYLSTKFHCEWTAVLSSVAKKGAYKNMPTVLTGSSIRSAIETEFDIVETQAGAFGKTPASMTSRVMNFVMPEPPENRARKLSTATGFEAMAGDMSAMADGLDAVYTEYTVTYKGKGYNPWYMKA